MSNPTYKPSEGKREEFRKYLDKNGVMDALTKVLVNLYEEVQKPDDALEYIRDKLASLAGLDTNKQLMAKLEEAGTKIQELEQKLQARGSVGSRGSQGKQADISSIDGAPQPPTPESTPRASQEAAPAATSTPRSSQNSDAPAAEAPAPPAEEEAAPPPPEEEQAPPDEQ